MQDYNGDGESTDPRIGHVLQGEGAPVSLHYIAFDSAPAWSYDITLPAGETGIIITFATPRPSKAKASEAAATLASLPGSALQGISSSDLTKVLNFAIPCAEV